VNVGSAAGRARAAGSGMAGPAEAGFGRCVANRDCERAATGTLWPVERRSVVDVMRESPSAHRLARAFLALSDDAEPAPPRSSPYRALCAVTAAIVLALAAPLAWDESAANGRRGAAVGAARAADVGT
jgi:hypothetical protein